MSQEGANLPQELEGGHDQVTAPHGSIPAGVGSPTATVMPVGSYSSSVSKLASAVNTAGSTEHASPAVLFAGEDSNAAPKIASPSVLLAGKENASKLAIQVVPRPHAGKDNNAGSSNAAKEGKNNISGEQQPAHEVDLGGGSEKGNAAAVEDTDPSLHIFTESERRKKMKNMFTTLHSLLPRLPDKADKGTIVREAITYIRTLEGNIQKLERVLPAPQQLVAVGAGSSRALSARHPAPAPPLAPASSREANRADMIHGLEAQQAAMAAANNALVLAVIGAGGSSSSSGAVPSQAPAAGFQTWTAQNAVVSVANNEAYINLHCPRELAGTLTKVLFVLERNHIEVITTTISSQLDGFRMYGIHARVNPAPASAPFPENLCAEDRFKLAVSEMLHLINDI